jgi:predicted Zn-dependent protease
MTTRAIRIGLAIACGMAVSGCSDTKLPTSFSDLMPGTPKDVAMQKAGQIPPPIKRDWPSVTEDLNNNRADGWGLISMPEMERYLNGLLAKIKRTAGVPDYPGTVHITADTALAASSSAAGNIYISQYWIQVVESEDEIFAVLSHEFGHVYLNHYAANDVKTAGESGAALAMLAWSYANRRASSAQWSGVDNIFVVQALGTRALFPAWQRSYEEQADLFGATISLKCGYSYPEGFKTFLERIGAYDKQAKERQQQLKQMQTTAARDQAVKDANKQPLKLPSLGGSLAPSSSQMGTVNSLTDALAAGTQNTVDVKGTMGGAAFDAQHAIEDQIGTAAESLQETHGDAAEREADLRKQITPLLGNDMPDARVEPWQNARKQGATPAILAHYALVPKAQDLQAQKRYADASAVVQTIASGPTANDGLPLYMLVNLTNLSPASRQDGAIPILRRNQNAHERSWQLQVNLAARMVAARDKPGAQAFLQQQFEAFGRAPLTWPPMIAFYRQNGDLKTARDMATSCTVNYPAYRVPCQTASQTPAESKAADQSTGLGHIHEVINKWIGTSK